MRHTFIASLIVVMAGSASAGEIFSGSHTYTGTAQPWLPVPGAGYSTATMVGMFKPDSGPIPESRIECRGTSFWTDNVSEAEGVCVFGELPDRWMLRYRMTDRWLRTQRNLRFGRRGEWTVIGGVGRFEGMTGKGTYFAKSGAVGADGAYKTFWAGEVTISK